MVMFDYLIEHRDRVWELTVEHMQLTLLAVGFALPVAILLALLIVRFRSLNLPVLGTLGLIYTIPSLARLRLPDPGRRDRPPTGADRPGRLRAAVPRPQHRDRAARVDPRCWKRRAGWGWPPGRSAAGPVPAGLPVIIAGIRIALVTTISLATSPPGSTPAA